MCPTTFQWSGYIFFDQKNNSRRTLVNSNQKHDIICRCFIGGTTLDHHGGLRIIPFFDVAQGCLTKTFRQYRRIIGLEEFMAPSDIPVSRFRPLLSLVISSTVLPQKLEKSMESGTPLQVMRTSYRKACRTGNAM